jgi:hypothetical protein
LPQSTLPFLGPQDFSGSYTPVCGTATTGGEATYHGTIVFTNLDRSLVQAILPQPLIHKHDDLIQLPALQPLLRSDAPGSYRAAVLFMTGDVRWRCEAGLCGTCEVLLVHVIDIRAADREKAAPDNDFPIGWSSMQVFIMTGFGSISSRVAGRSNPVRCRRLS